MKATNLLTTFSLACVLAILLPACTGPKPPSIDEVQDFARYFEEENATGTFVLYDLEANLYQIHDIARARKQFIPASTFKIPNSLIALETGALADTSTVLVWDGQERTIASWNRDHSMTTAFPNSVVWFYQEAARRIGEEQMQDYLNRMGYGNRNIGGGIDVFWLTGDLRISALEQIDLLVRLSKHDLPFSTSTIEAVKGIMIEEQEEAYVLRAKTGWAGSVGWYVGYIEHEEGDYFFALNIDMDRMEQAASRKSIARSIMHDLDLL